MQPQASRKVYVWSTLLSFKSETCVIYFEKISVCLYKITNILILGSKLGHWKIKYPLPPKKVAEYLGKCLSPQDQWEGVLCAGLSAKFYPSVSSFNLLNNARRWNNWYQYVTGEGTEAQKGEVPRWASGGARNILTVPKAIRFTGLWWLPGWGWPHSLF